jgi:ribosome-associated translation inhibitor RaiA
MDLPLQITFRHMDPSPALEARIRRKAEELDQVFDRIVSCRVVVECRHKHHQQGNLFEIHIDLGVPGSQVIAGRNHRISHTHEDAHVAMRDAFGAARRQLEEHIRAIRDAAKHAGAARQALPIETA